MPDGLSGFCISPESHQRIMSKKDRSNRSTEYAVMCAQARCGLMKWFSFGLGVLCFIYAGLYFLGLLPVGFWQSTIDLVMGRESGAYYKIVPTESFEYQGVVALSLGVVFIALSRWQFQRSKAGE